LDAGQGQGTCRNQTTPCSIIELHSQTGRTMQKPVEVSFHNLAPSKHAEAMIREHVSRLQRMYERMTACRVRVDQRNHNRTHSIPRVVNIEITVPGRKEIVVAHEPGHLQRKFQAPDLHNAINEAFRIAEQRLGKMKEKLTDHGEQGTHEAANEFRGQVAELT